MKDVKGIGYEVRLQANIDEVRDRVGEALAGQGFGILTEINVQATLKEKLGMESSAYLILGVCNPHLAHQALEHDPDVGLLLPCTVTLRADESETLVAWLRPQMALELAGVAGLAEIASEAERRLNLALSPLDTPETTTSGSEPGHEDARATPGAESL